MYQGAYGEYTSIAPAAGVVLQEGDEEALTSGQEAQAQQSRKGGKGKMRSMSERLVRGFSRRASVVQQAGSGSGS